MTIQEEEFVHFVTSIQNLNNAWLILKEIKEHNGNPRLINAAFQYAMIEYSKPYKSSRGDLKNNHKLTTEYIPAKHSELHQRIIDARDQVHAHSDLTVLEAKVYVQKTPYGKIAGHAKNIIYGTEELGNIDIIIDLIEQTLDNMYIREKELEQQLPDNSLQVE